MSAKSSTGPLGQPSPYPSTYTPSVLHSMDRAIARARADLPRMDEVHGEDIWHGYEFSWLDREGKPLVGGLRVRVPCQSPAIVESKSFKLYLNSFAQSKFENRAAVLRTLDQDLSLAFRSPLTVELLELPQLASATGQLPGTCLDDLDLQTSSYVRDVNLLQLDQQAGEDLVVQESLHSHLFRSLCPVTSQPDWASVLVQYTGRPIDRSSLLKYLISYRFHQAFHETTIEQIYTDLRRCCAPEVLRVQGFFVRRGGLDINPFRCSDQSSPLLVRLARQ